MQLNETYVDLKKEQNMQKFNFCRFDSEDVTGCKSILCDRMNTLKTKESMSKHYYVRYATWEKIT